MQGSAEGFVAIVALHRICAGLVLLLWLGCAATAPSRAPRTDARDLPGERPLSSPECYESILKKIIIIKSLPQAIRVPAIEEGSDGNRDACKLAALQENCLFPGVSEFGMQLGVCGELQSSHPKGAFFSTLVWGGGCWGRRF